jgi:hypothetical protein
VALFEQHPGLGLVHCGVMDIDASGHPLRTHLDGMHGSVAGVMREFRRTVILGGGSGAVVDRRVQQEVGDFDTRLPTMEDWDFYYRVANVSQVGFVPEVLVQYRLHGGNNHLNLPQMKKSMEILHTKIFAGARLPAERRLSRFARANLYKRLATTGLLAGNRGWFMYHTLRAMWETPLYMGWHLLGYPGRAWDRRRQQGGK